MPKADIHADKIMDAEESSSKESSSVIIDETALFLILSLSMQPQRTR